MVGRWLILLAGGAAVAAARPRTADAQTPTPRPRAPQAAAATDSQPVRVTGVVTDSVTGQPLGGAVVQMVRDANAAGALSTTADSTGAFSFPAVRPGRYLVGFLHPVVDALGIEPPTFLRVIAAGRPAEIELSTPSPVRLRAAICGAAAPGDSSGALVGVVRDATTGSPVPSAKVVVTWRQLALEPTGLRMAERRAPAVARTDGTYVLCNVPTDVDVVASADAPGRATGLIEVRVPGYGMLLRDLVVADSAAAIAQTVVDSAPGTTPRRRTVRRGSARLTGVVRDTANRPVPGATVVVLGTSAQARTAQDGRFLLEGLPAGTQSAEARAIGFAPARVAVDLASTALRVADVRLVRPTTTLSPVVVKAKADARSRGLDEFTRRKRSGFGRYVTAEDIERQRPVYITDVMRTMPGIRVTPNPRGFGQTVTGRAGCTPTVYLDGMQMFDGASELDSFLRPGDVAAVEVYSGPGGRPAQFSGDCVIAIWTKS